MTAFACYTLTNKRKTREIKKNMDQYKVTLTKVALTVTDVKNQETLG